MFLFYCDEQDDHGLRYSAVVCLIIHSSNVSPYRDALVAGLRKVFCRAPKDATPFPTLHAARLPSELSDDKKVELFGVFAECIAAYSTGLIRIGYHWTEETKEFLGKQMGFQRGARLASYMHMRHVVAQMNHAPKCFVQEFDQQNHGLFDPMLNTVDLVEQQTQMKLGGFNALKYLDDTVGYYYAPKRDHMLYATDFASYYLLQKDKTNTTDFQKRLLDVFRKVEHKILANEVLSMVRH